MSIIATDARWLPTNDLPFMIKDQKFYPNQMVKLNVPDCTEALKTAIARSMNPNETVVLITSEGIAALDMFHELNINNVHVLYDGYFGVAAEHKDAHDIASVWPEGEGHSAIEAYYKSYYAYLDEIVYSLGKGKVETIFDEDLRKRLAKFLKN